MRRALVKTYVRLLEWSGLLAGLLIIGSCTSAGYSSGGLLGSLGSFALSLVLTAVLVGGIYVLTTVSRDVSAIRERVESGSPTAAPVADRKPDEGHEA